MTHESTLTTVLFFMSEIVPAPKSNATENMSSSLR